jgi:HlyD family secretion protein
MKKWILILAPVVLVLAGAGTWLGTRPRAGAGKSKEAYEFATVSRGDIESVVSSSGTLSAVSTVSILSQMSGRVEKVNVDYNDPVKRGQVLVELNTETLRLEEKQAQADVQKARANYGLQLLDCQNKQKLFEKGLLAEYDYRASQASLEVYAAALSSAQAALDIIQTKLNNYARVTSPIDGIVLDRNVDVGQSVVEGSSSNASSLFTLAEDLARMEIKAAVDELDIASIKDGQEVRFTVEANPKVTFGGTVREIRLVPETTDNVVNYFVMIDAENREGNLLPGMTADVEFIKQKRTNVTVVPSAALRFRPAGLTEQEIQGLIFEAALAELPAEQREAALKAKQEQEAALASASGAGTRPKGLTGIMIPMRPPGMRGGRRSGQSSNTAPAGPGTEARKTLWYLDEGGKLAVALVQVGASDGKNTELVGAEKLEGSKIILKVKAE